MILDAICACSLIEEHGRYSKVSQNEILEILKERTGGAFKEGGLSYSTICSIVSQYIRELSSATLDDLYLMFSDIEDVDRLVRKKTINEFSASYIFPTLDGLKNGWAEKYKDYISILKSLGFEDLWSEKVLPVETEYIDKLERAYDDRSIDNILKLISSMKNQQMNDVTVYVSLLSYPVSFTLHEGVFLDTIHEDKDDYFKTGFLSMISHELMHSFSSDELIKIYRDFMKESPYLSSTHNALIKDQHSGDEEEFVMAAEYYIMWRSGIINKYEIVRKNYGRYGGCVPMALYIFEYMTREKENISNYNKWLLKCFKDGTFNFADVIRTIDAMMPNPNSYEDFFTVLFTIFHRCAFIIRDVQITKDMDIQPDIEGLTKASFIANEDVIVYFAKGIRELDREQCKRATLRRGRLTVDAITFNDKKDAFAFDFPFGGSNVGAYTLDFEGESYKKPYILNLAYPKDGPIRAELSFVCGNTRYFITSLCQDDVVDIDEERTYSKYGNDIIEAVRKAESIIMLLEIPSN